MRPAVRTYNLNIPDGCKVESANSITLLNGKKAILVLLAPVSHPKPGDFCIFWNNRKKYADVGILHGFKEDKPLNHRNCVYKHCIPFESEKQFKDFIKSE